MMTELSPVSASPPNAHARIIKGDWRAAAAALRELRREQEERHSDVVVECASWLLPAYAHKLGSEVYDVYEQVCVAALDCNQHALFQQCLKKLQAAFPDSSRVRLLEGLELESKRQWAEAEKVYEELLAKDDTNKAALKRQVAVLVSRGAIREAIAKLNEYLQTFMADTEAWQELCELYLQTSDYKAAADCVEELVLANPSNHWLHVTLAEIHYTLGEGRNLEIARSYYSHALSLHPDSLRAKYGLLMTLTRMSGKAAADAPHLKQELLETVKDAPSLCRSAATAAIEAL